MSGNIAAHAFGVNNQQPYFAASKLGKVNDTNAATFPRTNLVLQRTLRQPPLPGTTAPASGCAANQAQNAPRSSSLQRSLASVANVGVSMIVYMAAILRL